MQYIILPKVQSLAELSDGVKHFLLLHDHLKEDLQRLRTADPPRSLMIGVENRLELIRIHGKVPVPPFDLSRDRKSVLNFIEQHYPTIPSALALTDHWPLVIRVMSTESKEAVHTALMKAGACATMEHWGKFELYLKNTEEEFREALEWPEDLSPILKIVSAKTQVVLHDD